MIVAFLSVTNSLNSDTRSFSFVGNWCSHFQNDTLTLKKLPSWFQCSGMSFKSDGTMRQFVAPNVLLDWSRKLVSYKVIDSSVWFRTLDRKNKLDSVVYKIISCDSTEIILTLKNSR